ncbi:MAG: twin-arginine translocation signal domain-containing protein [Planctomycetota bacterium]|jgi:hypothetical protein
MGNTTRREFLRTVGAAAASTGALSAFPSCAGASRAKGSRKKHPNVVLVMTEADRFSCRPDLFAHAFGSVDGALLNTNRRMAYDHGPVAAWQA